MADLQSILALTRSYNTTDALAMCTWQKSGVTRFLLADDGELQLANATASGQGVLLGGDVELYRSAANVLTIPDTIKPTVIDVNGGTWTNTGGTWTIPAVTLGGTVSAAANTITSIGGLTLSGDYIYSTVSTSGIQLIGGPTEHRGAYVIVYGLDHAQEGRLIIKTPDAQATPQSATRLNISGHLTTAVAAWTTIYHTGMKFGLAGTATGAYTMDGATSGVVTMTVAAAAGTWTMTLPTGVAGVGGYQLADAAGDGVCSWTAAGSRREWKNPLEGQFAISPSEALDRILGTKVYPFRFKKGFGTGDYATIYQGLYADEAPWAMHFDGGILNPISTFGHTVLAIQALQAEIEELRFELSRLRA